MGQSSEDTLYNKPLISVEGFTFDSKVAQVFENMIHRSVPGYGLSLAMIELIASRYARTGSNLYDLGCSLGAATLAMRRAVEGKGCRIFGIDNSLAMLDQCRIQLQQDTSTTPIDLICADITDVVITDASLVILNFTLQFIPAERRQVLLEHIYAGMHPDGVLLLSEKICFDDALQQETMVTLHHDFKRARGYSELEVSQKRTALENVLVPETLDTHIRRMHAAGFSRVFPWFQAFNFASLIAFR